MPRKRLEQVGQQVIGVPRLPRIRNAQRMAGILYGRRCDQHADGVKPGLFPIYDTAGEFTYAGLGFIRAVNGDRRVWARGSPISQ